MLLRDIGASCCGERRPRSWFSSPVGYRRGIGAPENPGHSSTFGSTALRPTIGGYGKQSIAHRRRIGRSDGDEEIGGFFDDLERFAWGAWGQSRGWSDPPQAGGGRGAGPAQPVPWGPLAVGGAVLFAVVLALR